jgi:predicted dinucleotide-binding enzyme
MKTIGFIGAGQIGSALAKHAIDAGYNVVLSNSRGPETLADLVARLGPKARAATTREAAQAGDIVVVTIPLKNYKSVPVEPLVGKVVIDTSNYYSQRDGHITRLDTEETTTSELLQEHLPQSKVVKAFNHIWVEHLRTQGQPTGSKNRRALAIAGNDAGARKVVADFINAIGFDVVDTGPLAEGWRFQPDTPAYNIHLTVDQMKEALGKARRYAELRKRG